MIRMAMAYEIYTKPSLTNSAGDMARPSSLIKSILTQYGMGPVNGLWRWFKVNVYITWLGRDWGGCALPEDIDTIFLGLSGIDSDSSTLVLEYASNKLGDAEAEIELMLSKRL